MDRLKPSASLRKRRKWIIVALLLISCVALGYVVVGNRPKNQELSFVFNEADIAQTRNLYIQTAVSGSKSAMLTMTDNAGTIISQKRSEQPLELLSRLHDSSFLLQDAPERANSTHEKPGVQDQFWVMRSDGEYKKLPETISTSLRQAQSTIFPLSESSVIFQTCAQLECSFVIADIMNGQKQQINGMSGDTQLVGVSPDGTYAYFIDADITSLVKEYTVHAHTFLAYDIKKESIVREKRMVNTGSLKDPYIRDQAHRGQLNIVSPNGRYIAYLRDSDSIVIHDIDSDSPLGTYPFENNTLVTESWGSWSPDSKRLVLPATRTGSSHEEFLFYINIENDSQREITVAARDTHSMAAWSDFDTLHYGKSLSKPYTGSEDEVVNLEYDARTDSIIDSADDHGILMLPRSGPRPLPPTIY